MYVPLLLLPIYLDFGLKDQVIVLLRSNDGDGITLYRKIFVQLEEYILDMQIIRKVRSLFF